MESKLENRKKLVFIFCALSISLLFCMCEKKKSGIEVNRKNMPKIIKYIEGEGVNYKKVEVENIFNNDLNSRIILRSIQGRDIKIVFNKPIYVKEIKISLDFLHNEKDTDVLDKKLRVELYSDENEIFGDFYTKNIDFTKKYQIIVNNDFTYATLLKSKVIVIEIVNDEENEDNGKQVKINNIYIITHDKIDYKPTMTFENIKKKFFIYSNKEKRLVLKNPDIFYEENESEVKDLIYYALTNNKDVEQLFIDNPPKMTDLSEWHSALVNWYILTKKGE